MAERVNDLVIEGARILFKNFAGNETKYNPAGRRNFCVVIEDSELATKLVEDGWNVKQLKPREEGDLPLNYIQVAVRYDNIPPKIYLVSANGNKTLLNEDTVISIDHAEITNVDIIIHPSYWEANGNSGLKAYVKTMYVTIAEDPFESKYSRYDDEEVPFN